MGWYQWEGNDLLINVQVQPRASQDELAGPHGDWFKVRITAPPMAGKANSHLIKYLARCFGVAKSRITLVNGHSGRYKRLRVRAPVPLPASFNDPEM